MDSNNRWARYSKKQKAKRQAIAIAMKVDSLPNEKW
jgi:hypothetical protein